MAPVFAVIPLYVFNFLLFLSIPFLYFTGINKSDGMVNNTRPKTQASFAFLTKPVLVGLTFKQMCIVFCFIFVLGLILWIDCQTEMVYMKRSFELCVWL